MVFVHEFVFGLFFCGLVKEVAKALSHPISTWLALDTGLSIHGDHWSVSRKEYIEVERLHEVTSKNDAVRILGWLWHFVDLERVLEIAVGCKFGELKPGREDVLHVVSTSFHCPGDLSFWVRLNLLLKLGQE